MCWKPELFSGKESKYTENGSTTANSRINILQQHTYNTGQTYPELSLEQILSVLKGIMSRS